MNFRARSDWKAGNALAVIQRLLPRVAAAVDEGARAVLDISRQYCPVDTGALVSSGHSIVTVIGLSAQGFVIYDAEHAAFLEFGTGIRGRGTYPYDLPREGTPYTGSWVYDYKNQNWVGMPARPFLRPAIDVARPEILEAFRRQGFRT